MSDYVRIKGKYGMRDVLVPKDQNSRWKKRLCNSQLSELIVRVKGKYGLESKSDGFSWRGLEIDGVSAIPMAMDQGKSDQCIIYSSLALFKFQINLLSTEFEEAKGLVPSMDYMVRYWNTLESKTSIDFFLKKLYEKNLTDEAEFSKVKSLRKKQVKRFTVDYEYIEPEFDDFVPAMKEAIDQAGGVLFSMIVYDIAEDGTKLVDLCPDSEQKEGRKRKTFEACPAHVVFGHGWSIIDGKTAFHYQDSYGVNYTDDEGHNVCTDLSDICEVFVPQLSFKNSGFK